MSFVESELNLRGRAKAVPFVEAYPPTENNDVARKGIFEVALDSAGQEAPSRERFFGLMGANSRTQREEKEELGAQ